VAEESLTVIYENQRKTGQFVGLHTLESSLANSGLYGCY